MISSIKKKKCKCSTGCQRYPSFSCKGKNWLCLSDEEKQEIGSRRKIQRRKLAADNVQRKLLHRAQGIADAHQQKIDLWYLIKRYEMKGACIECGAWTFKDDPIFYKWSVCHVVPKGLVPSVAYFPSNWIELCKLHHQEYDATFERASKMKCFKTAKEKFQEFKEIIPADEARKINPYLLTP